MNDSSFSSKAFLLLAGRGKPILAQRQRLLAFAHQLGLVVGAEVAFRRRRHGRTVEQVLTATTPGAALLIESLAVLAKDPLTALTTAAELAAAGVVVRSIEEPWLTGVRHALPQLGAWLALSRQRQRAEVAKAALSRARVSGVRLGRPRRTIDIPQALSLVAAVGVARAASRLNLGETTLRRAVSGARSSPAAQPPSVWQPVVQLGGVQ